MTRDQFLVEQEGGCWHEPAAVLGDNDHLTCHKCKERKYWKDLKNQNHDFSKWENFGRLSKIAMDNRIGVHFNPNSNPNRIEYRFVLDGATHGMVNIEAINYDSIPDITATLIAQALGWKEAKT